MDRLIAAIGQIVDLSPEEWVLLTSQLEKKQLQKGDYLLREGQVCRMMAFVESGLLIYFKSLDNGEETTTDFAFPGDWVADNYSRLGGIPSLLNIRAIEDTELITIHHTHLEQLYRQMPKLERLGRILTERVFVQITKRSIDLQVLPAKDRYLKLIGEHPEILQQIPLYHIANYLGIAPKSLSRIRNTITGNKG